MGQALGTEDHLVSDLFERQAAAAPHNVAVIHGGCELTYGQLESRANRLARLLIARGAGPGSLVAIMLDRSADLVVTLLAVLKTGAGYVPIAPEDPQGRVRYVLGDSQCSIIVTSTAVTDATMLAGCPSAVLHLDARGAAEVLAAFEDTAPSQTDRRHPVDASDTAYVIYTSGSTGVPKGVVVEQHALSAYLDHACSHYPSVAGRTILHSSVSFDMAVTTIYAPLLTGGSVVIADLSARSTDGVAASWVRGQRPTFLKVTPSHLALLAALPSEYSPTQELVIGGESLTTAGLSAWRAAHPTVTVINEYGPTEATVGCCVHYMRPGDETVGAAVPIGHATETTRLHVLDDQLRPVPDGTVGELFIAGTQLARGYLGRAGMTAERFLPDPFGPPATRMYRTGDLVRRRPGGDLEFLGRADGQLKINGYRVEPGEVEAVLCNHPGVRQAAAIPRADASGGKSLIAYIVPRDAGPDLEHVRAHLAAQLPGFMVPTCIVVVSALPLTPNGKLDVAALPEPEGIAPKSHFAARTEPEALLCRLVGEVTGAAHVGIDDDFVALGGTSIAAARLVTRARRAGLPLGLHDVLQKRTVREMLADAAEGRPAG
jgi:amino acid adenylation domain-containing protein